jgi:hypothetical protein
MPSQSARGSLPRGSSSKYEEKEEKEDDGIFLFTYDQSLYSIFSLTAFIYFHSPS